MIDQAAGLLTVDGKKRPSRGRSASQAGLKLCSMEKTLKVNPY